MMQFSKDPREALLGELGEYLDQHEPEREREKVTA